MSKSATVYVFIDTNTALHFKRPDQIDWHELIDAGKVVLVATPILLSELEEQKVHNQLRKLRERAGKYMRWLLQFVESPMTEVRSNVTWLFLPDEPQIDFGAERLSESVADDRLIACVLCYTRQSGARPIVATADIGLKVKLKSRTIDVLALPDGLRLPDEPDPTERENEELRKKIAHIESRMPKLSITFEDGTQFHTLRIRELKTVNFKSLDQIKAEYPFVDIPGQVRSFFHNNQKLETYFNDYQEFLDQYAEWQEAFCMSHMIKLVITNGGTAPASNVDIELFFPDKVVPLNLDDISEKPTQPVAPRALPEILNRQFPDPASHLAMIKKNLHKMNTQGVPIVELEKNLIRISYFNLKHGFNEISEPVIFRFMSRDTMGSFKIRYRLSANELPDSIENDLHIRIGESQQ